MLLTRCGEISPFRLLFISFGKILGNFWWLLMRLANFLFGNLAKLCQIIWWRRLVPTIFCSFIIFSTHLSYGHKNIWDRRLFWRLWRISQFQNLFSFKKRRSNKIKSQKKDFSAIFFQLRSLSDIPSFSTNEKTWIAFADKRKEGKFQSVVRRKIFRQRLLMVAIEKSLRKKWDQDLPGTFACSTCRKLVSDLCWSVVVLFAVLCSSAMLKCYVAALCSSAMLQCYVAVRCWSAMLQCYVAVLCCSAMLQFYVGVLCCSAMLQCYVAVLCCSAMLQFYVAVLCCSAMLQCWL